jgi:branched-chain amino acid transport system substrate-binding protein
MTHPKDSSRMGRRQALLGMAGLAMAGRSGSQGLVQPSRGLSKPPLLIGIDAEFGLSNSTSAQAIELGARVALAQINRAGGVLGGRPLALVTRDHRSIAARGIRNIREFAAMPELVAVLGGRFSPVVIEQLPLLREAQLPFMAVWSAADAIVDNGSSPNFVFRVSLRDSLAMPFMLDAAVKRGLSQVGLLLTNTAWGRSNLAAAERYTARGGAAGITHVTWYNWQETSLLDRYVKLLEGGAQAVVLVANDDEVAALVREVAALPAAKRVPLISHWGVTGGRFFESAGSALRAVDFSVVQTFSFLQAAPAPLARFMATAAQFQIHQVQGITSPVGVAHAYDAVHLLALAIRRANSDSRLAVREALEHLPAHQGLVRRYAPAFTPLRHEALDSSQLLMARYDPDGVLVPA